MIPVITPRNMQTEISERIRVASRHDLLCFCLPTIEPETFARLLMPTFPLLTPIAEYVTIALNFQPPYNMDSARTRARELEALGFRVRFRFSEYPHAPGAVPFNRIRNDCAALAPEAKLYALLDDDMTFREGENPTIAEQYLALIRYMLRYPACGVGILEGAKPFSRRDVVVPVSTDRAFITGRGLVFKPVDGKLFPEDAVDAVGAGEEAVLGFSRLEQGMFPAALAGAKCDHYENQTGGVVGGGRQFGWSDGAVILRPDSCVAWQRAHGKDERGYFDKARYYVAGGLAAELDDVKRRYADPILPLDAAKKALETTIEIKEETKV